jgi:hypothetical protein
LVISVSRDPAENTSTSPLGVVADEDEDVVVCFEVVVELLPQPTVSTETPIAAIAATTPLAELEGINKAGLLTLLFSVVVQIGSVA